VVADALAAKHRHGKKKMGGMANMAGAFLRIAARCIRCRVAGENGARNILAPATLRAFTINGCIRCALPAPTTSGRAAVAVLPLSDGGTCLFASSRNASSSRWFSWFAHTLPPFFSRLPTSRNSYLVLLRLA